MKTKHQAKLLLSIILLVSPPSICAQTKYPYTLPGNVNGPVVVSRDNNGGVHTDALAGNANNRIEPVLQVAKEDADNGAAISWSNAQLACNGGWRLPTKRELQLIWLMGGADEQQYDDNTGYHVSPNEPLFSQTTKGLKLLSAEEYWSSTPNGVNGGWYVNFSNGNTDSGAGNRKVRCVKGLDDPIDIPYTISRDNSILLLAPRNANNGNPIAWNNINQSTICPAGYKLPNAIDMMLIWAYLDGFYNHHLFDTPNVKIHPYWSSATYIYDTSTAWYGMLNTGVLYMADKSTTHNVRCIKENISTTHTKYPYIDSSDINNGPIIVSADDNGGVDLDILLADQGTALMTPNSIAPKLQIMNNDIGSTPTWPIAKQACAELGNNWRIPTQREMMLMWIMGGGNSNMYNSNTGTYLSETPLHDIPTFKPMPPTQGADAYWTATTGWQEDDKVFILNIDIGAIVHSAIYNDPYHRFIRCVRTAE